MYDVLKHRIGLRAQAAFVAAGLILSSIADPLTQAEAATVTLADGRGYPHCVAMAAAIRRMPPSTDVMDWTKHLPPIPAVLWPRWTSLDLPQNQNILHTYLVNYTKYILHDARPDDVIWKALKPEFEKKISDGRIKVEETRLRNVQIGSSEAGDSPWVTDVRIVRFGQQEEEPRPTDRPERPDKNHGKKSEEKSTIWSYMGVDFSAFPNVDHAMLFWLFPMYGDLFLLNRQIWVTGDITAGIVYGADLNENVAIYHLTSDQRCLFLFKNM